jgi:hypothetical protein
MTKTGDRPTSPRGGVIEPINRRISKAPRPINPITGHLHVLAPKPSDSSIPSAPSGFVAFAKVPETLAANAEAWRIPSERLPAKADQMAHAKAVQDYLAVTTKQAAGIDRRSGSVRWAPDSAWRISGFVKKKK